MSNIIKLSSQSNTVKPVSVTVKYAESYRFESGKEYRFNEFETLSYHEAQETIGGGYCKIGVIVSFDNGHQYECRLDIAAHTEYGFQDHCIQMLRYAETDEGQNLYKHEKAQELISFIKTIQFDDNVISSHRRQKLDRLHAEADKAAKEEEERKQQEATAKRKAEKEKAQAQAEAFKKSLVVPADAKAVIVAYFTEYDQENSDPYGDYHTTKTNKTIILSWSTHKRDLFSEMRKAAKNHPETTHLSDKENSTEHREKYSMGEGYYLTNKDYIRAGIKIKKITFWDLDRKVDFVPVGELAVNNTPAKTKQPTKKAEPAAKPEFATVAPVKPAFKIRKRGAQYNIVISFAEIEAQYNNISADNHKHAGQQAWSLFTAEHAVFGPLYQQQPQPTPPQDNDKVVQFKQAQQAKKERYQAKADQLRAESQSQYDNAKQKASMIPFGQPILVGHHSEKRDRNYRQGIENGYRKSFEADKKADYYQSKADKVGNGGISTADPEAVQKLTKKLNDLQASQEIMKKANAMIRTGKESQLSELGFNELQIHELLNPKYSNIKGFAPYSLTNNNAEIRRVKKRIEELKTINAHADHEPEQHGCATFSIEDGRLCFAFDGIPAQAIRELLKGNGFKWSRYRKQWVRKATANALSVKPMICKQITELTPIH